jgi:hypothetical protein
VPEVSSGKSEALPGDMPTSFKEGKALLAYRLQSALAACGGVPKQHRTDSLSAAYKNLGGNKALTRLYEELCDHYRLQPTRNNTGIAHENGSIESPHGHLKNRIEQAIYLRGSNDFGSLKEYRLLIEGVVAKLNQQCQAKFEEENVQGERPRSPRAIPSQH